MNNCVDCGKEALGIRCRACNGKHIQLENARRFAASDAQLLAEVAEGLTGDRLAARRGISRARAWVIIRNARKRQSRLRTEPSGS